MVATTATKLKSKGRMTAAEVRLRIRARPDEMSRSMETMMASVKGTSAWMKRNRTDVLAMMDYIGKPSW